MSVAHREAIVARWLYAAGIALGPLLFFVLPATLFPSNHETAEAMFAAAVEQPARYTPLFLQIVGALFWILGAIGVRDLLRHQNKGRWGQTGAILVFLGAFSAFPLIGIELAQMFIVASGTDSAEAVRLAVALNNWATFGLLLATTLLGLLVGTLLQVIGLVRSRIIPAWSLLFFAMPLVSNLIPLPVTAGSLLGSLGVLIPLVWVGVRMLQSGRLQPMAAS